MADTGGSDETVPDFACSAAVSSRGWLTSYLRAAREEGTGRAAGRRALGAAAGGPGGPIGERLGDLLLPRVALGHVPLRVARAHLLAAWGEDEEEGGGG